MMNNSTTDILDPDKLGPILDALETTLKAEPAEALFYQIQNARDALELTALIMRIASVCAKGSIAEAELINLAAAKMIQLEVAHEHKLG